MPRLLIALFMLVSAATRAQSLSISDVPTTTDASAIGKPVERLRVHLFASNPTKLADTLGATIANPADEGVIFPWGPYKPLATNVEHDWLADSFVVDYKEPAMSAFITDFKKFAGDSADPGRLIEFVSDQVTATTARGLDVASRVAKHKEGDCTEYTVLLTALARGVGIPARMVIGVAVTSTPSGFRSVGHAWSEFKIGDRWIVADAALRKLQAPILYVPAGIIEDEGFGFVGSFNKVVALTVRKVIVLGN